MGSFNWQEVLYRLILIVNNRKKQKKQKTLNAGQSFPMPDTLTQVEIIHPNANSKQVTTKQIESD